jgi:hypothetical protein
MVPVPVYGHLYLNSGKLSRELICEAFRDNPRVMVDRATRKICGMPELPPTGEVGPMALPETPAAKEAAEHEHHAGMEMQHEEQGRMTTSLAQHRERESAGEEKLEKAPDSSIKRYFDIL